MNQRCLILVICLVVISITFIPVEAVSASLSSNSASNWQKGESWPQNGIPPQYEKYEQIITAAVVNFAPVWGDKEANLQKMERFIEEAAQQEANIIVFPEMALQGYLADPADPGAMQKKLAETIPGPSTLRLAELASKYDMYIVVGMSEKDKTDKNVIYNSAALIAPEGVVGSYHKVHPWEPELQWCIKGNEFPIWETRYGPMGIIICYDFLWIPEQPRIYAVKGARFLASLNAAPSLPGAEVAICGTATDIIKITSLQNALFMANSGTIERAFNQTIVGTGCIAGPNFADQGLAHFYAGPPTDPMKEELFVATLDFAQVHGMRKFVHNIEAPNPYTGTPDRRPELYGPLAASPTTIEKLTELEKTNRELTQSCTEAPAKQKSMATFLYIFIATTVIFIGTTIFFALRKREKKN